MGAGLEISSTRGLLDVQNNPRDYGIERTLGLGITGLKNPTEDRPTYIHTYIHTLYCASLKRAFQHQYKNKIIKLNGTMN